MKVIENTQKQFVTMIQQIGINKEIIIDTGSPVTIMPPDERIMGNSAG